MKISIVGCGWLGLPLGKKLVEKGHEVVGSTTSQEKFKAITKAGIQPVLLKFQPMPFGIEFNQLFNTDCLIINIPPNQKQVDHTFYEEQIKYLKYLVEQFDMPRVIFVSSTSYYPNTNTDVDENTPFDFDKGSSKAIVQAEKQIRQVKSELLVLRCAGLMGGDRIPGKWFAGKETTGANTLVNYIHRDDVIGIISKLLNTKSWELKTPNLVCPEHPTRKEVHEEMADKYGFKKPIWIEPAVIPHKKVTSRIGEVLDYGFKFRSPLDF